jgi:hypothetical protein
MDLTTKIGRALTMWDRKILIKIDGPTNRKGYWRTKIQQGVYNVFKSPDIVTVAI